MNINELHKNLKNLVWKDTSQTIDKILQIIDSSNENYNQLILLKASLQDNQSLRNIGAYERSQLNTELNQIRSSLLKCQHQF